jgi:hypothetical protein
MAFLELIKSVKKNDVARLISIIIGSLAAWFLFLSLVYHWLAKINF